MSPLKSSILAFLDRDADDCGDGPGTTDGDRDPAEMACADLDAYDPAVVEIEQLTPADDEAARSEFGAIAAQSSEVVRLVTERTTPHTRYRVVKRGTRRVS